MSLDRNKKIKKCPKSDIPKEFKPQLQNNVLYSLTLNPKEQYLCSSSRYLNWYSSIVTHLKYNDWNKYCMLDLNTEISYPLTNGVEKRKSYEVTSRLHLHGTIRFFDVVGWFIYVQPELVQFAIYEIDTIDNVETWNNYIIKDKDSWTEHNKISRPFTEYNINMDILTNLGEYDKDNERFKTNVKSLQLVKVKKQLKKVFKESKQKQGCDDIDAIFQTAEDDEYNGLAKRVKDSNAGLYTFS